MPNITTKTKFSPTNFKY